MPRGIVISKLDDRRATFADVLSSLQDTWGPAVQPAYVPIESGGDITGNLSLVSQSVHDYSTGKRVRRDATEDELTTIEEYRAALIEGIIQESEDDDLMDRYLEGDHLKEDELVADLMKAIYTGRFFPVVPVNSLNEVGTEELLTVIKNSFPMPSRKRVSVATVNGGSLETTEAEVGNPDGPLLAEVIRTTSDQFSGRASLLRIFNGRLKTDDQVQVLGQRGLLTGKPDPAHPDHDDAEKAGGLTIPVGCDTKMTHEAVAGQLVFVAKLSRADTSDTVAAPGQPVIIPWNMPEPLLPIAIKAESRNDEDKLPAALHRLAIEDSAVRIERTVETDQTVLWTMGQGHVDLLMSRLQDRYGVKVNQEPVTVALRETFVTKTQAEGRHV
jgi:elongation factor G